MDSRERAQRLVLEPHQAVYHAAHDKGIKGIAGTYGVSATILANKLNPECASNTLDLRTVLMVWEATRDPRIPEAFAACFGGIHVPDSDVEADHASVLCGLSGLNRAMSNMVDGVVEAFADGVITRSEEAMVEAAERRLAATARRLSKLVKQARRG